MAPNFLRKKQPTPPLAPTHAYAFCETIGASGNPHWHIRKLTPKGRKESGGADTPSLCGKTVAWDLGQENVVDELAREKAATTPWGGYCQKCVTAFEALSSHTL